MLIPTPRLVLRDFEKRDWRRIFEYQSDPSHAEFNAWEKRSEKDAQAFVSRFLEWQREKPRTKFQLAIQIRSEGKLIGNCGIRSNPELIEAELGFELDRHYWHRGYATEAANAMLDFAFTSLRISQVRAQCISENEASSKVLRRLGMSHQRTEQTAVWMKERWWSTEHYGVSSDEWVQRLRAQAMEEA